MLRIIIKLNQSMKQVMLLSLFFFALLMIGTDSLTLQSHDLLVKSHDVKTQDLQLHNQEEEPQDSIDHFLRYNMFDKDPTWIDFFERQPTIRTAYKSQRRLYPDDAQIYKQFFKSQTVTSLIQGGPHLTDCLKQFPAEQKTLDQLVYQRMEQLGQKFDYVQIDMDNINRIIKYILHSAEDLEPQLIDVVICWKKYSEKY